MRAQKSHGTLVNQGGATHSAALILVQLEDGSFV